MLDQISKLGLLWLHPDGGSAEVETVVRAAGDEESSRLGFSSGIHERRGSTEQPCVLFTVLDPERRVSCCKEPTT